MTLAYYQNDSLYIENCALETVVKRFHTPCYVYSKAAILHNWQLFQDAFSNIDHQICYAVKANANLAILNLFARCGAGFDIVSQGELEKVLAAQGDKNKIIFSGVGKSTKEIERAIKVNIFCFDVESFAELERINEIAKHLQTKVNVAIRINPNVDAQTHVHISTGLKENKFGISGNEIITVAKKLKEMSAVQLIGLACHIGSQLTDITPILKALDEMLSHYNALTSLGFKLSHINIGGGLGIKYHVEKPPSVKEYAQAVSKKLQSYAVKLIIEPGRALIGNTGDLLTTVEYLKHNDKNFAIVDAGMNDLIRPALYDAYHEILSLQRREGATILYDIVGPVCESSDYLGRKRQLNIQAGDVLAIETVGAYGFSMTSNYNSRLRPAEVLIDGDKAYLIQARQTYEALLSGQPLIEFETY